MGGACDGESIDTIKAIEIMMWSTSYLKMEKVLGSLDDLVVVFRNGDIVKVPTSSLTPLNSKPIRWKKVSVVEQGELLSVPAASGDPLLVSSETLRSLTDQRFAAYLSKEKAKEAKIVGSRLRMLREMRGLSQTQVAKAASTHRSNLCRIEAGSIDISTSTLLRLLGAMGYEAHDFFKRF
jgi:DNA-binding XRE family transcriptional regulator